MGVANYEEIHQQSLTAAREALEGEHYEEAEKHFSTAVLMAEFLWPGSVRLAATMSDLAGVHERMGKHADAENLYQRALKTVEESLGQTVPELVPILQGYAALLKTTGRQAEAEKVERRIWLIQR
ncbi:MAG: tetratricopeptide repeat protein [Gammaproteobacteria bacterium]